MAHSSAIVLFGDVTGSRRASEVAAEWLRALTRELDETYADHRLAPFAFTQGDELQGLLDPGADPITAVLRAGLHPAAQPIRWVAILGPVEAGHGPATERTGPAFLAARDLLARARRNRDGLTVRTGHPETDALLADLAPLLPARLAELTDRQREVARLSLIEGLRQVEIADRLGISRSTVSVLVERARIRELEQLTRALRTLVAAGIARGRPATGAA